MTDETSVNNGESAKRPLWLWDVQGSTPDNESRGWSNVRRFVVAPTMEKAMSLVRDSHPGCVFHQAIRRNGFHTTGGDVLFDLDDLTHNGGGKG